MLECSNYRPISLLSNLDQIIEKLMHKRLMVFLNEQKILYYKQYGFYKRFLSAHAIINLIGNIKSAIDSKQFVCGVFTDLQKHLIKLITFYLEKYSTMVSEEQPIHGLEFI